eukprot:s2055_g4.t1
MKSSDIPVILLTRHVGHVGSVPAHPALAMVEMSADGDAPPAPEAVSPQEEFSLLEPLINEPLKAGSSYFLINQRWYVEWLQWSGAPSVQSPQMRPADPPLELEDLGESGWTLVDTPPTARRTRQRTGSWTKDRPGQIDNSPLLEENSTTAIKKTLDELNDYRIIPEGAWNLLFGWYGGGPPIKRRAITLPGGSVQVELFGLTLKALRSSEMTQPPYEVVESKSTTIGDLKANLCSEMNVDASKVRIWDYFELKPFALLEGHLDATLESQRIMDQNYILLEEPLADGSWGMHDLTDHQSQPEPAATSSGYPSYPSYPPSSDITSVGEPIQRGVVGLQNLGNTCFMNSSLQCLSNIPQLREYFLDGAYKETLNRTAHKTEGKLAESFAELLDMMWKPDTRKVAPRTFKWQVGQFAEQFSGYGQQDSMELIEYVLDGLKEDCNAVQGQKPYIELKEADGRPDEEVAAEALSAYHARSKSRVDDLFVGLFKSVVRCPDPECGRTSVTFDPFLSAKLSLSSSAEQRQMAVNLVVVRDSDSSGYQQVTVKVHKEASIKELIKAVAEEVGAGLKASNCILVEILQNKVYKYLEDQESVETIHSQDKLLLSEMPDARPFCKSGEQRWGLPSAHNSPDEEMGTDDQPSSSSSFGVVLYQRRAVSLSYSSYSYTRDVGVPLLMTIPKDATVRMLYKKVERDLQRLFDAEDAEWKIFKVSDSKYHCSSDEQLLDPESDQLLQPQGKESRLHFAIEWQGSQPFSRSSSKVDGDVELVRLLQMFVQEERLSSEDAWYCNRCKEHKEAFKKLEFHNCPPVLVLQLKRFQYTRWSRERLNNPVSFPLENLDLSPYLTASAKERCTVKPVYDLAAVSKHIGSLGGGHYVAFSRSSIDGAWYYFDDSTVRRCSEEDVASDKVGAYVLFYIRQDHRPEKFGGPS